MKPIFTACLFTAITLFSASYVLAKSDTATAHIPLIQDAWTTAPLTEHAAISVYFTLENQGDDALKLIRVHSPIAKRAEIHETTMDANGVMNMDQRTEVIIPAKSTVNFKPHGLHIMLFGLTKKLDTGEEFPLMLKFSSGEMIKLEVKTRPLSAKMEH